ncbi:neutral zinc metallopeptidase [Nonomuraea sp. NPDC049486]|uniref:neutral zinc metallopeptidase n=1 Tax=Nonomuraea sp. NPDC049486 TaxID=3155773 RepID=UPI0034205744
MGVVGVLGLVCGTIAGLFVLVIVGAAFLGSSSGSDTTTPIAQPTYSPYDEPTRSRGEPTSSPTQDDVPTERPTQRPTQDDEPDDDPPRQVTLDRSLKNNTVYRAGVLPRLTCRAGNVSIFSHSQLKSLILKTGKCMDQAWGPILQKQGIPFSPPRYAIAARSGRGACGDYPQRGSIVPYYCPRNNTIYASTSAMARGNGNSRGYGQIISWHGGIISMMAHEYGHHVQNLTGLLDSWWGQTLETSNQNGKLALSRRLELQATCFGGMWMRSVAASYPVSTSSRQRLFWFYGQVGDHPGYPRDHGSTANNHRWFRQGWEKNKAYQCNTWAAPSSTTS